MPPMTIEIHSPEAEAIIRRRMSAGGFQTTEDVIIDALKSSVAVEKPVAASAAQEPVREKSLVEICDPIRGPADDIDLSGNPSPSRPPAGRKSLAQVFADSPFKGLDIDFEREPDYGRDVTL